MAQFDGQSVSGKSVHILDKHGLTVEWMAFSESNKIKY